MMSRAHIMLLIVFLEGYAVLSLELLAIRQGINFFGSNTDKIAIIIAAVLVPLAAGYFTGGRYRPKRDDDGRLLTLRRKLLGNIEIAALLMTIGLSYATLHVFFAMLITVLQVSTVTTMALVYALIFVFTPCFFLGQTVPLVSNFFPREKQTETAGKILFVSTVGSFMGSVFCTLVLMKFLGVNYAVPVTIAVLLALALIISKKPWSRAVILTALCLAASVFINTPMMLSNLGIVEQNPHSTLAIRQMDERTKILMVNNTMSSLLSSGPEKKFPYITYAEENFIVPATAQGKMLEILILGAGGFTLGLEDPVHNYTYVDVDPAMRRVAEEHFLEQKLLPNKTFVGMPARAFLSATDKKYDIIFMDIAFGMYTVPEQLMTREYFSQIKNALKPEGIFFFNFLGSPTFLSAMSAGVDNALHDVFPFISRHTMYGFNAWNRDKLMEANITYAAFLRPELEEGRIITAGSTP